MKMLKVFVSLVLFISALEADISARAVIVSTDRTVISAEIAGKLIYLPKGEGEYFKKGKLLAKIDCDIYEAQLRKIEVQKRIASLQMQKDKELEKLKSIGSFEVLISQEEYNKQKAEEEIVSVNVKRCKIYAPFNGRVVAKKVNRYQSVKPQQEILEIVGTSDLEAKVVVPSTWLSWLKKGDEFMLSVDETQTNIKATVKEIGSVVDTASQTVLIRASLQAPLGNIIAGMSATANFIK